MTKIRDSEQEDWRKMWEVDTFSTEKNGEVKSVDINDTSKI